MALEFLKISEIMGTNLSGKMARPREKKGRCPSQSYTWYQTL